MSVSNSSVASVVDFTCKRGDTFLRELKFWSDNAKTDPVDITAMDFNMKVIGNCGDLKFEIGSGFTITPPNILTMSKTAAEMKKPAGSYVYDIQQTTGSTVVTILKGKFIIENDVTA